MDSSGPLLELLPHHETGFRGTKLLDCPLVFSKTGGGVLQSSTKLQDNPAKLLVLLYKRWVGRCVGVWWWCVGVWC